MQCNTNYTGRLENFKNIQLNVLKTYRNMYPEMVLGLSDHTPGHTTVLGAIALGAKIIEKHFTDDVNRSGPDHAFSMDAQTWREMCDRSKELEHSLGQGIKRVELNEKQTVILQRRCLRLVHNINEGQTITEKDLEALRPCPEDALPPYRINEVIGKKIKINKQRGEHLRISDIG